MTSGTMKSVVHEVGDLAVTEASGGITLERVREVAATGVISSLLEH